MPDLTAHPSPRLAMPIVLGWMMFLLPALGSPTTLLVQDSLKSALLAFGVLGAALAFCADMRFCSKAMRVHGLLLVPLALLLYALGSVSWSHAYLAGVEAVRWLLLGLLMWLGMQRSTPDGRAQILAGIHAGACVASAWAAAQFWLDWSLFAQAAAPASSFTNRNFFAEYAVCALPFSVWLCTSLPPGRWLYATVVSLAFNLSTILMTGTRSAIVALVLVLPLLLLLLMLQRKHMRWYTPARGRRLFTLWALALVVFVNLPARSPLILSESPEATAWRRSTGRAVSITQPAELRAGSFAIRTSMWLATLRMMQHTPWQGVGAGAWEVQIPLFQDADSTLELDYYAHNEFLQLLSEYGLPLGITVIAVLLAFLIKCCAPLHRGARTAQYMHDKSGTAEPLAAGALAPSRHVPLAPQTATPMARWFCLLSLLALGVVSCAGFPWHLAATSALLALSLGWLCGIELDCKARTTSHPIATKLAHAWQTLLTSGYPRAALQWLLLVAMLLAAYCTQRAARAEYHLIHAVRLANTQPRDTRLLSGPQQQDKIDMLNHLRLGVQLNPYYRKLTPLVAEVMMAQQDWRNAVWILQSVAASHPNVYALWHGLAQAHAQLHEVDAAGQALTQLQRLRPHAILTHNLEIVVLSERGQDAQARQVLDSVLGQPGTVPDFETAQIGYALALKLGDQALAIRALQFRLQYWPQQATDSYFRMGQAYAYMAPHHPNLALQAFARGLDSVPPDQRLNYLQQVPAPFAQRIRP